MILPTAQITLVALLPLLRLKTRREVIHWYCWWTPLYTLPGIKEQYGLKSFWLKDDGKNPTASFKDRASAVLIARARQIGAEVIVTASTGNAGAALAGMAAAVGQKAVIFAPKTAPTAKVAQS